MSMDPSRPRRISDWRFDLVALWVDVCMGMRVVRDVKHRPTLGVTESGSAGIDKE